MNALLSRHAECLFWFGRYTERAACLARLLEVHSSISQGRTGDAASWSWILTLYDDHPKFQKTYDAPSAANVLRFYISDRDNPGSLHTCIHLARENARTLRALISTDLWQQVNTFYNRFRALPAADLSDERVARTCQLVKKECYAQIGVAEATLYRDAAWSFFHLGVLVERADQMSRLLDVRFAQARSLGGDARESMGDFGYWALLLRSAAAQQSFLRRVRGQREPAQVARFLIFDSGLPRSIAYCVGELETVLGELRSTFGLRGNSRALEQADVLREILFQADSDPHLVDRLHAFNDGIQQELMTLTSELAYAFFGHSRPESAAPDDEIVTPPDAMTQSQSQSSS
jgi:uncharacterized alpha-E superfamily protein